MKIDGILFDVNGTMIDILTDEGNEEIYRGISHFLTYQGININRWELRDEYFILMDRLKRRSKEAFPEFNVVELWRQFIQRRQDVIEKLPSKKIRRMPLFLAEMYRGISRFRLQLYPAVKNTLDELQPRFKLAVVTDAQSAWAIPEMRAVGIDKYFAPIVVSGDFGFRKPDKRLFFIALENLHLRPGNVIFVGNDMYHDIYGAKQCGMKTVFFSSNQGRKTYDGVEPDYIIYHFAELLQAIHFFEAN
ncbi:MAG: HAD family hydrolase [Desulfomonilaceae bacterium]